jgi:hypothetical protein
MSESAEIVLDLATALGSEPGYSTRSLNIYIPNKDKDGNPVPDQGRWVEEALRLLSEVNGGATAMPPVDGVWRNDDGTLIRENPIVVYSFVRPAAFVQNLPRVREFLHRLGRETNQGEIAVEFEGRFYRIRQYDPGTKG